MSIAPETTIEEGSITVIGNTGQVAIGNNIVQEINHNCVINKITPGEEPIWERGSRLEIKPRKPKKFLNRTSEIQQIESEIQAGEPLILSGPDGIGKSTLIEYLSHLVQVEEFPDGLYHLSALDLKFEDLLQNLFSTFFESNVTAIPNRAQIQNQLREIKALILIDDVMLSRDEVKVILNIAPQCVFILVSSQLKSQNWIESLSLEGLPESEAQSLFEQALDRSLDPEEKSVSYEICRLLKGHPESILLSAAKIREEGKPLKEIVSVLTDNTSESLFREMIQTLPQLEQQILITLAAADGRILSEEHLYSLVPSEVKRIIKSLDHLIERNLIRSHYPTYSLADPITRLVAQSFDISLSEDVLIKYFVDWLAKCTFDQISDDILDTLLIVLRKASLRQKWSDTIKIGRVIGSVLFFRGYWKAWEDVLHLMLEAAGGMADRKAEALAMHQLGSRLFCLDFKYQAKKLLKRAASIRQDIGDFAGLEVTQHNLSLLPKVVMPKIRISPPGTLPNMLSLLIGLGSVATLSLATFLGLVFYKPGSPPLRHPPDDYIETTIRNPQFEWESVILGETYQFQVDDQDNFDPPEFNSVDSSTRRTLDTSLDQGVYYWRVRGINRYDKLGKWSETWQITISIPPATPSLTLPKDSTDITETAAPELSWEDVENGTTYQVQVDDNNNFETPEYDTTTPETSSKVTTSLARGVYYWKVQAFNIYGTPSEWSETWEFTISIPLVAPKLSKPEDEDTIETTTTPKLEWESVEFGVNYEVWVDDNSDFSSPIYKTTTPETNSTIETELKLGVYYWKVRAFNIYGTDSDWSEFWKFRISPPPAVPDLEKPKDKGVVYTTTMPTFSWESVTNAVKYHLQIDNDRSFNSPVVNVQDITSTSETINISALGVYEVRATPVIPQGVYYWRVMAFNKYNTPSEWSETWEFTISIPPNPPQLKNPSYQPPNSCNLKLEWYGVKNAASYRIQIDDNVNFSSPIIKKVDSTSVIFSNDDLGLPVNTYTEIYWQVKVVYDYGLSGPWSVIGYFIYYCK